MKIRPMAAE